MVSFFRIFCKIRQRINIKICLCFSSITISVGKITENIKSIDLITIRVNGKISINFFISDFLAIFRKIDGIACWGQENLSWGTFPTRKTKTSVFCIFTKTRITTKKLKWLPPFKFIKVCCNPSWHSKIMSSRHQKHGNPHRNHRSKINFNAHPFFI